MSKTSKIDMRMRAVEARDYVDLVERIAVDKLPKPKRARVTDPPIATGPASVTIRTEPSSSGSAKILKAQFSGSFRYVGEGSTTYRLRDVISIGEYAVGQANYSPVDLRIPGLFDSYTTTVSIEGKST